MRTFSDGSITILVGGLAFFTLVSFILFVGGSGDLRNRLFKFVLGGAFIAILVSILLCLTEQYWLCGHTDAVTRIHAFDPIDTSCTISVFIGLKGANITLIARYNSTLFSSSNDNETVMLKYNEQFVWAWGTKLAVEDYSNPYYRILERASVRGIPLPIRDVAERFRTYGPLGGASAGIGLHEAGYYANMCLSCGLAAWMLVGMLPTLSPYASCYSALVCAFFLLTGSLLHVIISYSMNTFRRTKVTFPHNATLTVRYNWCFWLNIVTSLSAGIVFLLLKKRAEWHSLKMIRIQQEEHEEIEQMMREPTPALFRKRRLTVVKSSPLNICPTVVQNVTAVRFSELESTAEVAEVIEMQSFPEMSEGSHGIHGSKIVECDINYTGPITTMLYVAPVNVTKY